MFNVSAMEFISTFWLEMEQDGNSSNFSLTDILKGAGLTLFDEA